VTDPPQFILNEIMYDASGADDGREWVEVYNAGSDADLSALKLFENETNHGITAVGSAIVPAGGFAVIADNPDKFMIDWPDYAGLLFDSTFSLSNTGESLAIKDADGNVIDQLSYSSDLGAGGNDRSLQKNGNDLIEALPTPGEINKSSAEPPAAEDDSSPPPSDSGGLGSGGGTTSSTKTVTPKPIVPKPQKFTLKIDAPSYAISNSSFNISALVSGGEKLTGLPAQAGRYVWNFGNGEVIEAEDSSPFDYNYQFPGSYLVTLNYYKDEKSKPVKVTAKIKVDENPISISEILQDGSVEIHNKATHQIDISGWILKSGFVSFTFPAETEIVAESSIIFPAKVTKFSPANKDIDLLYPNGTNAFSSKQSSPPAELKPKVTQASIDQEPPIQREISSQSEVKGADLSASVLNSLPNDQSKPLFPWILGLGGIILVSSIASFFIFSGSAAASGSFKILD
jgi:hypothetical protein